MAAGSTVTWSVLPCAGFGRICGFLSCQSQPRTPIKLYSLPVVPREIITSHLALKSSSTGPASQLFPASDNRESKSLEMGGIDTHITASAFVVSLVAFFIALGQLLQQYFATADGYRRCQRSVMGNWARKARLRWRWREFRFETLYTTPDILLVVSDKFYSVQKGDCITLDGTNISRKLSLVESNESLPPNNSYERVCWIPPAREHP